MKIPRNFKGAVLVETLRDAFREHLETSQGL